MDFNRTLNAVINIECCHYIRASKFFNLQYKSSLLLADGENLFILGPVLSPPLQAGGCSLPLPWSALPLWGYPLIFNWCFLLFSSPGTCCSCKLEASSLSQCRASWGADLHVCAIHLLVTQQPIRAPWAVSVTQYLQLPLSPAPLRPPDLPEQAQHRAVMWEPGSMGRCKAMCSAAQLLVPAPCSRHCASCCLGKGFHDTKYSEIWFSTAGFCLRCRLGTRNVHPAEIPMYKGCDLGWRQAEKHQLLAVIQLPLNQTFIPKATSCQLLSPNVCTTQMDGIQVVQCDKREAKGDDIHMWAPCSCIAWHQGHSLGNTEVWRALTGQLCRVMGAGQISTCRGCAGGSRCLAQLYLSALQLVWDFI